MKKIVFKGPINSLSFGNVSLNFLREFYKREMQVAFFPIGEHMDFAAFDKVDDDLKTWIKNSFEHRYSFINKDIPTLCMWHINGSETRVTERQFLYTFYECDSPTFTEKQIVNLQNKAFFSSSHAKNCFSLLGLENTENIPLGFDPDFHKTDKEYLSDKIHFGIMGKFEKRKHTERIIKLWVQKYGDNPKYHLTCCVNNPFFKPDQMNALISNCLNGRPVGNINFLPHLPRNSEVNEFINSIDIDLSGMSGAEGWNLPSFNSTCLGKWSLVLDSTSHKDWSTPDNCIPVKSSGDIPIYDGAFFHQGAPFNQGSMKNFDDSDFLSALDIAESKAKTPNPAGESMKEIFTYSKTIDSIINKINE